MVRRGAGRVAKAREDLPFQPLATRIDDMHSGIVCYHTAQCPSSPADDNHRAFESDQYRKRNIEESETFACEGKQERKVD